MQVFDCKGKPKTGEVRVCDAEPRGGREGGVAEVLRTIVFLGGGGGG